MRRSRKFLCLPARLSLLLAATLHFAGIAGGWAHAGTLREIAAASSEQPRDGRRPHAPAPHDERSCVVCHAFSGAALPTGQTLVPSASARPGAAAAEPSQLRVAVRTSPHRARAPPLA